jgi:hypothetical protein
MFVRGSRYRDVPQSVHLSAKGELIVSSELRVIPARAGIFLHQVRDRDRLDLLAFKYYSDSTRWWQIADANPELAFPLDLVDRRPLVEEELALTHSGYTQVSADLEGAVAALGTVRSAVFELMSATITVSYSPPAVRGQVLAAIALAGFKVVSTFAWPDGGLTAEAFTIEAPAVKQGWQALLAGLAGLPGMRDVLPRTPGDGVHVTYNEAVLGRDAVIAAIEGQGFAVVPLESVRIERVGARVTIPPDRVT